MAGQGQKKKKELHISSIILIPTYPQGTKMYYPNASSLCPGSQLDLESLSIINKSFHVKAPTPAPVSKTYDKRRHHIYSEKK